MKIQREHWGSRLGFIMAAAGSAIGLGSVWRFPYTVGENGGGAFVLLYLLFTAFLGLPVFIAEVVIGRHSQTSAILAYSNLSGGSRNWKMLGWLNLIACFIILSFYSVVAGWCLCYTLMSLMQFTQGKSPDEIRAVFDTLFTASDINIFWLFIFILLNVGVVYAGVRKGIERWSKILTPALLVILVLLFFHGISMPGFGKAAHFIFSPDFSKITPNTILNALGMAFFTLSVGLGIILTYGSYMKETEDLPKTGLIIAFMTIVVSLLAAMTIFPIVFSFDFPPEGGPGLVFKTMPVLFAKLPGSLVISTVFFLLLLFTALTSSISLLEMLVSNLIEIFSFSRKKAVCFAAGFSFILGVPSALSGSGALFPNWHVVYGKDFFETMNYITASWMMPISGLLTTIFVGWKLKKHLVETEFMSGTRLRGLFKAWLFAVKWLAPIAVAIIILTEAGIIPIGKK